MKRLAAALLALLAVCAYAQERFGKYVGSVKVEWLVGRDMKLLEDFAFIDPKGVSWLAPKGAVINGASIPKVAWSVVGGPYEDRYRDASVIHDVACDEKKRPWEDVHEVFYYAMRASGVQSTRARLMYGAVYHFGPRWEHESVQYVKPDEVPIISASAPGRFDRASKVQVAVDDHFVQGYGASGKPAKIPTGLKKVTVRSAPPPTLPEADAEALRRAIVDGDLSLEQIRNFRAR